MDITLVLGLAAFGAIFLLIGINSMIKRKKFEASGLNVVGKVEGMVTDYNLNSKTYYPVINYTTIDGKEIEKQYHLGSNPAAFKKGEEVQVIYLHDSPKDFIIAGKFTNVMGIIFNLTGFVCIMGAIILYIMKV